MQQDQERSEFLARNKACACTVAIIALNVVVYAIEAVLSGFSLSIDSLVLVYMGAMYAPLVQGPLDLYRFVTPMFLHMDLMHLLFNMVALYSVGMVLERILGHANFLLLYFIAGITGNAVSYATALYFGSNTLSAGASTSVFGLFVAVALLAVLVRGNRLAFADYSKGMLSVIAINVVYSLLMPGISIAGHLGGAIGGAIAMLAVPSKNLRVPNIVRVIVALLWICALAYLLVAGGVLGA